MQFHSWYPGPFLWNSLASNQSQRDRHKRHVAKKHYSQFHRLSILTERLFVVQSSRILQKFRARIRNEDLLAQKSRAPEEFAGRIRCETTCTTRWNFLHERKLSPRKRERERERKDSLIRNRGSRTEIFLSPHEWTRTGETSRLVRNRVLARGMSLDLVGLTWEEWREAVSGDDTTKMRRTKCQGAWLAMCMQGWHAISRYSIVLPLSRFPAVFIYHGNKFARHFCLRLF